MRHAVMLVTCFACATVFAAEPAPDPKAAPSKDVATPPEARTPIGAAADLKPTQGNSVNGMLSLNADQSGVRIGGLIKGLAPNGEHGFHIHEKGDCSAPDASSAGAHFNPTSQPHGNPKTDGARHLGDMVNLRADAKGVAKVEIFIEGATLHTSQANNLVGKAIVVHQKPDDYKSQPSGNSGDRVACGVISSR
jgi:Cu-Zn family superoxide dismutase